MLKYLLKKILEMGVVSSVNHKYLLRIWIPTILIITACLFSLIPGLTTSKISLISLPFAFFFLLLIRSRVRDGISKALQSPDPQKLEKILVDSIASFPDKDSRESFSTYHSALAYVLYGDYEQALEKVKSLDWSSKPPLLQAPYLQIQSLTHYLGQSDVSVGLRLARKAKALASCDPQWPGSKKSEMVYDAYVLIGQVLSGLPNSTVIASLEEYYKKLPIIPRLFVAWGLANAYKQTNQMEKANAMLAICKANAPYCKGINTFVEIG